MIKKPVFLLLGILMLASCDNSSNVLDGDNNTVLLGSDLDENGIRDDVETYITTLPITDTQKQAARFEAKALQQSLMVDTQKPAALQESSNLMVAAVNCINSRFDNYEDADAIGVSLEDKTFNTSERAAVYEKYNQAQVDADISIEIPTGDTCQSV